MSCGHSHPKPGDRLRRAKSEISHNRISTDTLRTEFRSKFFDRLRNTRSKSVDRFRQIVEDYGDSIQSISDVRRVLLQDKVASNLLATEEVSELLNQIEHELEQVHLDTEGEAYVKTLEKETEDTVNRLLNVCEACGKMCEEEKICSSCVSELTTEFK